MVTKSKLKKADPQNRAACKTGNSVVGGGSAPTFTLTCQNTTMAELVENLQQNSIGDITHPVIDSTGLTDAYDFVISWTPRLFAQMMAAGGGGRGDAGAVPGGMPGAVGASDPTGGPSMMEAFEKQLGLKLELQKHPMPVLVIDHIEQKPTEN